MNTPHTMTPEARARSMIRRYGVEGAMVRARNAESKYESAYWQSVGTAIDRLSDAQAPHCGCTAFCYGPKPGCVNLTRKVQA
jgi:hypothetical protein